MSRFEWRNGNLGIGRYGEFGEYFEVFAREGRLLLRYDETYRNHDERVSPWEIEFTLENGVPGAITQSGTTYTDGTITDIRFRGADGDVLIHASNLDLSLAAVSGFLASGVTYDLFDFITAGGHRFIGSNDASGPGRSATGDDIITGSGDDVVNARGGDDFIRDRGGEDFYKGGAGYDTLSYDEWYWTPADAVRGISVNLKKGRIVGPDGSLDLVEGIEAVQGSFLADRIVGDGGNNTFKGMQGHDFINGRGGYDTVTYRDDVQQGGSLGIVADLGAGTVRDGFGTVDRVRNVEVIVGTDSADLFIDDDGDSLFRGHLGRDEFRSGLGNDSLEGGGGADLFVFRGNAFGTDRILDYTQSDGDRIRILQADGMDDLTFEDEQSNLLIRFGENVIELSGFYLRNEGAGLTEDDFIF